ncbi:hypothetical protein KBB96_01685 [Luteolibacter ambystomatis]|uniref:Lipoprotein n=1 Tax=Luteolibacter ambystomatis TaxID=2824561 RepID=A0A975J076_9BACT|nr:hypothetical protein [Luteolibacter ambystomatis]QUE51617.1 hypothetical protein KBB96_01685 [Luteolibacter ambystomatis]
MFHRLVILFAASICCLSSCAIVKAPFTIAGAVVEGTYNVGEKIVTAPIDAYDRRQARKDAEKEKSDKEAEKKKAKQPQMQPQQGMPQPGTIMDAQPLPPIAPPQ